MNSNIEDKITLLMKEVGLLKSEINKQEKNFEEKFDSIFTDLIAVIDTFEKAEITIKERNLDNSDDAKKAIKRLLTAKKRATAIMDKYCVEEIVFTDNITNDAECTIIEVVPDMSKPDGSILSIDKSGYRREGKLLRRAEVIIVKN